MQRYTCGPVVRQELGGICTFSTILYLPGKSASRPRERLFMPPPLAELGLVGGCVAADTEGLCMGRAWHGRAVARGRVASDRAESCKCTGFRVPVIPPLAPQRSEVIFLTHERRTNARVSRMTNAWTNVWCCLRPLRRQIIEAKGRIMKAKGWLNDSERMGYSGGNLAFACYWEERQVSSAGV